MSDNNQNSAVETLRAAKPFFFSRYRADLVVSDTKGNELVIGRKPSGLRSDVVNDPQGNHLCKVERALVNAILPRKMTRFEFSYDFEAPVGSIPNLCNKKESPSK